MEDYLVHHGILGQRWGVRRYQNPDGTLTAEGRKRRKIEDAKYKAESLAKVDKYYDNNYRYGLYALKKKAGINNLKQRISEETDKSRKEDLRLMLKYQQTMKKIEKQKVKSLSHDEIMNERKVKGEAYLKAVAATVTSSVAMPGISWLIFVPSPQKSLSESRISDEKRAAILKSLKSDNYNGNILSPDDVNEGGIPWQLKRKQP